MTGPTRRVLLVAAGATAVELIADGAAAQEPPVDRSVARRYHLPTPNSEVDTGGAIIGVNGPIDQVMKVVQRYGRYDEILPRLSVSKVVGKKGSSSDVYLRAPILNGTAHIWAVARLTPSKWGKRGKKIVGRYLKGNLEALRAVWKLHPCGSKRTILRLELYLIPKIPLPADVITPELEWSADKAVTAVRDMVECGRSTVIDD